MESQIKLEKVHDAAKCLFEVFIHRDGDATANHFAVKLEIDVWVIAASFVAVDVLDNDCVFDVIVETIKVDRRWKQAIGCCRISPSQP